MDVKIETSELPPDFKYLIKKAHSLLKTFKKTTWDNGLS